MPKNKKGAKKEDNETNPLPLALACLCRDSVWWWRERK